MKKVLSIVVLLIMIIGCSTNNANPSDSQNKKTSYSEKKSNESKTKSFKIKITLNDGEIIATLVNNQTTQSLIKQLPLTTAFEDFASAEKITYFPNDLVGLQNNKGYDPRKGDIVCYEPWGNMAIYYKDQPFDSGLIYMGRIDSGLALLSKQKNKYNARIELID